MSLQVEAGQLQASCGPVYDVRALEAAVVLGQRDASIAQTVPTPHFSGTRSRKSRICVGS